MPQRIASGGAFVTAPDWSAFWDALYGHKLLSPAMTAAMLTPQVAAPQANVDRHYGLGNWLVKRGGDIFERFVMGSDFGVGMVSVTFPLYDVELTLLDNVGDAVWGLWGALVNVIESLKEE